MSVIPADPRHWPPEEEMGSVEYKSRISASMTAHKLNRLITQMKWRFTEGARLTGQYRAHYVIGVHDEGNVAGLSADELTSSVEVLRQIVEICEAQIKNTTSIETEEGHLCVVEVMGPVPRRAQFESDRVDEGGDLSPGALDFIEQDEEPVTREH